MSEFAVIAELPLGAYRARTRGGHLDPVPSPVRLHAALLCAAATGPRAVAAGPDLRPNADDLSTLHWLEQHPPDGVLVPRTAQVRTTIYGYRREGTITAEGRHPARDKVVARAMVGLVTVGGAFAWTWKDPPPPETRKSLDGLCGDVAYLGNADTPVRMRVGQAQPTHRRAPEADLFATADGLDVDVPTAGRTDALTEAHSASRKPPKPRADGWTPSGDTARSAGFVETGREPSRYLSVAPDDEPDGPWSTVLLAGFGEPGETLRDADHVGWATAVHRALVAVVGDGAPAVLTGYISTGGPSARQPRRAATARSGCRAGGRARSPRPGAGRSAPDRSGRRRPRDCDRRLHQAASGHLGAGRPPPQAVVGPIGPDLLAAHVRAPTVRGAARCRSGHAPAR